MLSSQKHTLTLLGSLLLASTAHASNTPPDAAASDPATLGWMVGSPPPADKIIRFEDGSYFRFPQMRWSVSHFRQLMPTVNISRGLGATTTLPRALRSDIDTLTFTPTGSKQPISWQQSLAANYTDGMLILHKGKVVYERYFGVLKADGQHGAMSVTKTFIGTLAASLAAGATLEAAVRRAVGAGALACTRLGVVPSLLTLAELDALIA